MYILAEYKKIFYIYKIYIKKFLILIHNVGIVKYDITSMFRFD